MADASPPSGSSSGHDATTQPAAETRAGEPPLSVEGARVLGAVRAGLFGDDPALHIDRFVVLRRLGAGGMGEVMLAYDPQLDRNVAIKLVRRDLVDATRGPAHDAGLLHEARAAARLQHPNVVSVYEIGRAGDRLYVAMEYVAGRTLRTWSREEPRGRAEILQRFEEAGRGLQAAHGAGLVHRDFKPDNVLVGDDGRVRVVDFGIASLCVPGDAGGMQQSSPSHGAVGTPRYMAPEQFLGEVVDARADQFAFCVSLWEIVGGAPPFRSSGAAELAVKMMDGAFDPPPRRIPGALVRVLARGMRADPRQRFADMDELLTALARIRRAPARRTAIAGIVGALVVGGAAAQGLVPGTRCAPITGGTVFDDPAAARTWADTIAERSGSAEHGTHVLAMLDDFEAHWRRAHDEACAATHERGEDSTAVLDARMACLRRTSTRARTLVDRLTSGDRGTSWRAIDAIAELPLPERCLQSARAVADASTCTTEIDRRLDDAATSHELGDTADALAIARDALAQARDCGSPTHLADARTQVASLAADLDEPGADTLLEQAATAAITDDAPAAIARAASRLAQLHGAERGRGRDAQPWIQIAAAAVQRADDDELTTDVTYVQARVELETGDTEVAAGLAATVLQRRRAERGEDHPSVAAALTLAAWVEQYRERWDEALALHRRAIEIRLRWYPDDHPVFAASKNAISSIERRRGEIAAAEADLRSAIAILEHALGPEHRDVASPLVNLADLLAQRGETDAALELLVRVDRIATRDDNWRLLEAADVIRGIAFAEADRLEDAEVAWRRVLALRTARAGVDDPATGIAHHGVCRVLTMRERFTEALEHCRRSIAIDGASLGPRHLGLVDSLVLLAEAARGAGEIAEARAAIDRAIAIAETNAAPHAELDALRAELDTDE